MSERLPARAARLPAAVGGGGAVGAAVAGAAAQARQGARRHGWPSGAARARMRAAGGRAGLAARRQRRRTRQRAAADRAHAPRAASACWSPPAPSPRAGSPSSGCRAASSINSCRSTCRASCAASSTHWRPDLALFVESDLWPNMMIEASRARRADDPGQRAAVGELRSGAGRYLPDIDRRSAAAASIFALRARRPTPSASASWARRASSPAGNLKLDVPAPPADARASSTALQGAIGGRPVIAAASTHAGEEAAVIEAHRRLRANFPGLLTLIAPRHPERGAGVAELAGAAGLKAALALARRTARRRDRNLRRRHHGRTRPDLSPGAGGVHRRLAGPRTAGRTRSRRPSSAPPSCTGRMCANFAEIYAALDAAHGAEPVADADAAHRRPSARCSRDPAARERASPRPRARPWKR